jgi:hypothetical protein
MDGLRAAVVVASRGPAAKLCGWFHRYSRVRRWINRGLRPAVWVVAPLPLYLYLRVSASRCVAPSVDARFARAPLFSRLDRPAVQEPERSWEITPSVEPAAAGSLSCGAVVLGSWQMYELFFLRCRAARLPPATIRAGGVPARAGRPRRCLFSCRTTDIFPLQTTRCGLSARRGGKRPDGFGERSCSCSMRSLEAAAHSPASKQSIARCGSGRRLALSWNCVAGSCCDP